MKAYGRFALALTALAILLAPVRTFALSLREYQSETKQQRADYVAGAIQKIIADVNKANPELAKKIHDYFLVVPKGQPDPPGIIAFAGGVGAAENLADQGKLDPDKVQIEGILLTIIKRDVMSNQDSKNQSPSK